LFPGLPATPAPSTSGSNVVSVSAGSLANSDFPLIQMRHFEAAFNEIRE
jgi:hypothetical protein